MISVMKFTEGLSDSRGIVHWFVATAIASLTTLALVWLHANSTTAGMVFLALVVWTATQAGLTLSLYHRGALRALLRFFLPASLSTPFGWPAHSSGLTC